MGSVNNLSSRMNQAYKRMSKGQRRLSAYITNHYEKAAFLTAAKLGEAVGVSESTVVRFAMMLGYKGYPAFQRAMADFVQGKLSDAQGPDAILHKNVSQSEILEAALKTDIENITHTLEQIDSAAFEMAVEAILSADCIYIVGIRSCAPLAGFLAFYFNLMFERVRLLHTNSSTELFEQMLRIGSRDVIIGISFPRYSMRTLKAMEFANQRNARVITLTDSVNSPLNLYSSCNLIAKSKMTSVVDSLAAPLSVINALIVAVCRRRQSVVSDTLQTLERIWEDYQVEGNDEIEPMEEDDLAMGELT